MAVVTTSTNHLPDIQELLRSLSDKIRAESAGSVIDVRRRARLAEVGATKALCSLCSRFLIGRPTDDDTDGGVGWGRELKTSNNIYSIFLSPGQIRDALDSALLDARELKSLREEAEASLASLWTSKLDARSQTLLAHLAEQETSIFDKIQEHENANADSSTQALKTCVADMSKVLLETLCAARDAGSDEDRRALATEALAKIEGAAGAWATWFAIAERKSAVRLPPEVTISRELSAAMSNDARLRALVVSLRHAMKLRRHQVRMVAALRRLRSAVGACDAITSLSGSVVEP